MITVQMKHLYLIIVAFTLTVFASARADACSDPKDREFDFWIGEWDIANLQANPGNPSDPNLYPTGSAVARVFPVAGGCGIVELWEGELSWGKVLGFSLRSYDATMDKWTLMLNWPAPNATAPAAFTMRDGGFHHGRGEFFSSRIGGDGQTIRSRFTFSDINEQRYRWDGATSVDGGVNWQTTWVMEGSRRDGVDIETLKPGPLGDEEKGACGTNTDSGGLAFLEGKWSGESNEGTPVKLEVLPVMGGCAVLEFLGVGGEQPWEEFRVRAYQSDDGHWLQYSVNNREEGMLEWVGESSDGIVEWSTRAAKAVRETVSRQDDEVLRVRRWFDDHAVLDVKLYQQL